MIYTIVGTDVNIREKARKELSVFGQSTAHVYSEHIHALSSYLDIASLFGEKSIVSLLQVLDTAEGRERVYSLLQDMKDSSTIFIIDDPFADAPRVTKLGKFSEKLFDARVPKKKEVDIFSITNYFERRDKKALWSEWMKIKDLESPEAIQGIVWWKFVQIWGDTKEGKPSKFSLSECEALGAKLLRAPIQAHRGKADLKNELEEIILMV